MVDSHLNRDAYRRADVLESTVEARVSAQPVPLRVDIDGDDARLALGDDHVQLAESRVDVALLATGNRGVGR